MKRSLLIYISIAALLIAGLSFAAEEAAKPPFRAVIGGDGVQRVDVLGGEYFFEPRHIIFIVNVPVEMTFKKNWGIVPHTIVMNEPEAGMKFNEKMSSTPKTIKFTPIKVGVYPIICDKKPPFFKSHRDKGMEGIVQVVEP